MDLFQDLVFYVLNLNPALVRLNPPPSPTPAPPDPSPDKAVHHKSVLFTGVPKDEAETCTEKQFNK